MRISILFLLLALVCRTVVAAPRPPSPDLAILCETAIRAAEVTERLPARLLGGIARVESGRMDPKAGGLRPWPWTINAEGEGQFFASKEQAVAAVRALLSRGVRSIDIGCMQVNLMYHPSAFASLELAFDPLTNVRYGARFLNTLYANSHDWMRAVGDYHSQTPVPGADYRQRVLALWTQPVLSGQGLGLAVAYHDFSSESEVYRAFTPPNRVYAAFTPTAAVRH